VTCHFINDFDLKAAGLEIKNLEESHSSANISEHLLRPGYIKRCQVLVKKIGFESANLMGGFPT
jgi:hypothetical protein